MKLTTRPNEERHHLAAKKESESHCYLDKGRRGDGVQPRASTLNRPHSDASSSSPSPTCSPHHTPVCLPCSSFFPIFPLLFLSPFHIFLPCSPLPSFIRSFFLLISSFHISPFLPYPSLSSFLSSFPLSFLHSYHFTQVCLPFFLSFFSSTHFSKLSSLPSHPSLHFFHYFSCISFFTLYSSFFSPFLLFSSSFFSTSHSYFFT
ncbi:hypothetical protein E2C01_089719 [Portunus trituberculatus]|uniref:Uncharacterized protein n=1 Tax=Portunus trituberculatus TaxID=210409 RepID=A0A5B7JJ07_PORTR|nr:hypothetical protein [Portunus trituberculatus]